MDFIKILRSFEEFLYEVMTWLLFYPRTLWRAVSRPLDMIRYSDNEQGDAVEDQYTDSLSPPLFLMLSLLIAHGFELAMHATITVGANFQRFFASDETLLFLRCIAFSLYPLLYSAALLKRRGVPLDRERLRRPFFGQCYVTAPVAMLTGIIATLGRLPGAGLVATFSFVAILIWFLAVQARWFRMELGMGQGRAALLACWIWLKATILIVAVAAVLVYR
jgi:hypothetical protein